MSNKYTGIPPDLWPRNAYKGTPRTEPAGSMPGSKRDVPPPYIGDAIYVGRSFQGRAVSIGTTPSLLVRSEYASPYIILNPSRSTGLTNSFTVFSGTVVAAGNSQSNDIGVANYLSLHFHLNVTAITGTWDIIAQTKDPITGAWADSQTIFGGVTTAGIYYATIGPYGVVTDFAIRWNPTAAGSITFNLTGTLKNGIAGGASGLAQTLFIGSGPDVNTIFGFPILEGQSYPFVLGENVEIYGVALVPITVNIFQVL